MADAFTENCRFQARYNRWINQRLYDACETLSDAERKRDCGAFFGSIHGTLSHLIVADPIWLKRFAQCGQAHGIQFPSLHAGMLDLPEACALDTVLFENWPELRARRAQLDLAIEAWAAELPEGFALLTMRYSNSKGLARAHPAWQAITHFFNHQTHHRGQATTLLTQAGVEVGVTDLIALA
ncbi:DinB family protein [Polaromonas jejuensis]|uniref:DinB family protein n=1 Tax=Polaromonas jejuensis TaxID=457502 RepID=A0ABW0QD26_9BURK|nr:DinB family protein [Polaromonas jejuensis]